MELKSEKAFRIADLILRYQEETISEEEMEELRLWLDVYKRQVYHNCLKVLRDRNIKELCLDVYKRQEHIHVWTNDK